MMESRARTARRKECEEENMDKHIAKMIVAVVWLLFILALCLFSGTYWWMLLFLATSYIVSIID